MSFIFLFVNDWLPTALFGVVSCVVLETDGCGGLTEGNGLAVAIPLLFFAVFFFALSVGRRLFVITLLVAYPHTKLPHTKLALFDSCFVAAYVNPFNAQNQPLAFEVSNNVLTTNINKNNNLSYLNYAHSIVWSI